MRYVCSDTYRQCCHADTDRTRTWTGPDVRVRVQRYGGHWTFSIRLTNQMHPDIWTMSNVRHNLIISSDVGISIQT